jgi:hypothetical protein
MLHIFHLRTKGYASHKASQEYYEAIVGLIDGLIENLQGETLQLFNLSQVSVSVIEDNETIISYLQNLSDCIKYLKRERERTMKVILQKFHTVHHAFAHQIFLTVQRSWPFLNVS